MRLIACLLALIASPLAAQTPGTLRLSGEARTGADQRAARFEFVCSSNGRNATGVLGVSVELPRHETLSPVFDFNRFEGPDADAGVLTRLETSTGPAGRFAVSGSIGVADDVPFVFGLYAARRRGGALGGTGPGAAPLDLGGRPADLDPGQYPPRRPAYHSHAGYLGRGCRAAADGVGGLPPAGAVAQSSAHSGQRRFTTGLFGA